MQASDDQADGIDGRTLRFMCRVLEFALDIPDAPGAARVADQLVGAAGGIGANLEKARAAATRRDFLRFNGISLRESRETAYWLIVCERAGLARRDVSGELLAEARRIARIIGRIVIDTTENGV